MIQERYTIEGERLKTARNAELTSSLRNLERAMEDGEILEAVALVCSPEMNITVDLCGIRGIIPKSEAALPHENEASSGRRRPNLQGRPKYR